MKCLLVVVLSTLLSYSSSAQDEFLSGELTIPTGWSNQVYLSVKNNYRTAGIIDASDIIAKTRADSVGRFFFPRSIFTKEEKIYELHLSESEEEVEMFISDFQAGGMGNNFLIFSSTNNSKIKIKHSEEGRVFGAIISDNKAANKWQQLNGARHDYLALSAENGENAKKTLSI
ncbi:MAG: hypothetical protein ACI865_000540 [Flavobacteriaceae bacterium]|jgi:hypothetical protein